MAIIYKKQKISAKKENHAINLYHAKLDISFFENSVDPDQLASEKPVDQDLNCFSLC